MACVQEYGHLLCSKGSRVDDTLHPLMEVTSARTPEPAVPLHYHTIWSGLMCGSYMNHRIVDQVRQ